MTGTDQDQNKQTLSRSDLLKHVEVIRSETKTSRKVLEMIPKSLSGPLATIAEELRRINQNVDHLSAR